MADAAACEACQPLKASRAGVSGGTKAFVRDGKSMNLDAGIGQRTPDMAHTLLRKQGLGIVEEDIGGSGHRSIRMCQQTSEVICKAASVLKILARRH